MTLKRKLEKIYYKFMDKILYRDLTDAIENYTYNTYKLYILKDILTKEDKVKLAKDTAKFFNKKTKGKLDLTEYSEDKIKAGLHDIFPYYYIIELMSKDKLNYKSYKLMKDENNFNKYINKLKDHFSFLSNSNTIITGIRYEEVLEYWIGEIYE